MNVKKKTKDEEIHKYIEQYFLLRAQDKLTPMPSQLQQFAVSQKKKKHASPVSVCLSVCPSDRWFWLEPVLSCKSLIYSSLQIGNLGSREKVQQLLAIACRYRGLGIGTTETGNEGKRERKRAKSFFDSSYSSTCKVVLF